MAVTTDRSRRSTAGSWIVVKFVRTVVVAALSVMVLAWPSGASAHAILEESTPVSSSVLEASPAEIRLDFNESIEDALLSIQLFDAEQREVRLTDIQRDNTDTSIARAQVPKLGNGVFVVVWRAVSADGHPVSGAFPFQVGNNATVSLNDVLTQVLNGLDTQSPLGVPLAVSRFLAYIALVALIGVVAFAWNRPHLRTPQLVQWMPRALIAFVVGSLGVLFLQGPYAVGRGWEAVTDGGLLVDVLGTRIGLASLARVALAAGWGALIVTTARSSTLWWRGTAVLTGLLSVVTFSVSGHASAASLPGVFVPVGVVHFSAVAVWVGSFFSATVVRTEEGVARLSVLGTVAMPVAVVTGAVQSWHLLGGVSDVFDTNYGNLLFTKVFIIGACLLIGLQLRRRLKSGQSTVTRMLTVEAVLLAIVIAVTAFMVGTSPQATAASTTYSSTHIQSDVVVDFSILPTRVGAAEVHVYLTPPGGSLSPVENVEMSFSLPARSIPAIPVDLIEVGPNHWSGIMQFPYDGEWTMETRVRPTATSTLLYTSVVPVAE